MNEYSFVISGSAVATITVEAESEEVAIEQALRYGGYDSPSQDWEEPYLVCLTNEEISFRTASIYRVVNDGELASRYESDVDLAELQKPEPWDRVAAGAKSLLRLLKRKGS